MIVLQKHKFTTINYFISASAISWIKLNHTSSYLKNVFQLMILLSHPLNRGNWDVNFYAQSQLGAAAYLDRYVKWRPWPLSNIFNSLSFCHFKMHFYQMQTFEYLISDFSLMIISLEFPREFYRFSRAYRFTFLVNHFSQHVDHEF